MPELKGTIKNVRSTRIGFRKALKLTIGTMGFKSGEVIIEESFPDISEAKESLTKKAKAALIAYRSELEKARKNKDTEKMREAALAIQKAESELKKGYPELLIGKRIRIHIHS